MARPAITAATSLYESTMVIMRRPRARIMLGITTLLLLAFALNTASSKRQERFRQEEQLRHEDLIAKIGSIPDTYRYNYLWAHADPARIESYIQMFPSSVRPTNIPPMVDALLDAKWMGDFPLPKLSAPTTCPESHHPSSHNHQVDTESTSVPAFLMLHIFSAAFAKERPRRALIRHLSPLRAVPKEMRHLVEVKFVVGHSGDPEEEAALDREEAEHGDLIRLDNLQNGENMDQGKTQRWAKWVGRPGGREAQWVIKCDSDTLPVMPNLLDFLTTLDPSKPTYVGTTLQRNMGLCFYMNGFMYGFSWGIFSLPSKPGQDRTPDNSYFIWDTRPPVSPDPRTGLIRIDTGERMADFGMSFRSQWDEALSWHRVKSEPQYVEAYQHAEKSFRAHGRPYVWQYPQQFEQYRSTC